MHCFENWISKTIANEKKQSQNWTLKGSCIHAYWIYHERIYTLIEFQLKSEENEKLFFVLDSDSFESDLRRLCPKLFKSLFHLFNKLEKNFFFCYCSHQHFLCCTFLQFLRWSKKKKSKTFLTWIEKLVQGRK